MAIDTFDDIDPPDPLTTCPSRPYNFSHVRNSDKIDQVSKKADSSCDNRPARNRFQNTKRLFQNRNGQISSNNKSSERDHIRGQSILSFERIKQEYS